MFKWLVGMPKGIGGIIQLSVICSKPPLKLLFNSLSGTEKQILMKSILSDRKTCFKDRPRNDTVTNEKVQLLLCAFHANVSFANKKVADAGKNVSKYKPDSKILNCVFLSTFSSSSSAVKQIFALNVWMFSTVIACLPQSKVFNFKNIKTLFIVSPSPLSFVSPECVPSPWVLEPVPFNMDTSQ